MSASWSSSSGAKRKWRSERCVCNHPEQCKSIAAKFASCNDTRGTYKRFPSGAKPERRGRFIMHLQLKLGGLEYALGRTDDPNAKNQS